MADFPSVQTAPENVTEYEAIAEQLLAEMRLLDARMQRDRIEIDCLKAETALLKAESARLEAENRATLSRLTAAW